MEFPYFWQKTWGAGFVVQRCMEPIGIFDSGVGGLTVVKAVRERLPDERIVYFGDTKHLPYGDKSLRTIREYCDGIVSFLLKKNCKTVVIACNSASAGAYDYIQEKLKDKILVLDVITPAVKQVAYSFKNIGVIATKATVRSNVYLHKIKKINGDIQVNQLATPLLAPMIEEGFYNNKISETIINNYLSDKSLKDIECLILACTHYPLIQDQIDNFFQHRVKLINSAEAVAKELALKLKENSLLNGGTTKKDDMFYVSDYTPSFHKTAKIIFGKDIELQKV